jgi:hypothetical protein
MILAGEQQGGTSRRSLTGRKVTAMPTTTTNSVTFTGNLGKPGRFIGPGEAFSRAVCYCNLALDMPGSARPDGGQGPLWITLVAYDDPAAHTLAAQTLAALPRGTRVTVRGELDWPQFYTSRSGTRCIDLRVNAHSIEPVGRMPVVPASPPAACPAPSAAMQAPAGDEADLDVVTAIEQVIASVITALPALRPVLTGLVSRRA